MKRILTAVLLCLLALLCGCAKKPEAEPLAQEAVSVPAAAEPEIVPETAEPKPEASWRRRIVSQEKSSFRSMAS